MTSKDKLDLKIKLPNTPLVLENVKEKDIFGNFILRIVVGDYSSSICLFDQIFDDWNGPTTLAISSLIKSLFQFSATINGGEINKIVLETSTKSDAKRRMKSIMRDVNVNNSSKVNFARMSLHKEGSAMLIAKHIEKKVFCGIFIVAEDFLVSRTQELALKICKTFIETFPKELEDEDLKKMLNNLKEGKIDDEKEAEKQILEKFAKFEETLIEMKLF